MPTIAPSDIAAVVVLYRPGHDVVGNVATYAGQVGRVFAIDNTEQPDPGIAEGLGGLSGVEYVALGENTGIAAALNSGMALAKQAGFSWVLTMDQDSTPYPGMLSEMLRCAAGCEFDKPLGMLGPVRVQEGLPEPERKTGCFSKLTMITSGALTSVDAWDRVGRFDEGLFIDQVDHDLCLRMHRKGLAVIQCRDAWLRHRLGDTSERRFRGGTVRVANHSALRRYYITRNRFEVVRRYGAEYPKFRKREMGWQRGELAKIVLYEDHKLEKLRMSWRGYRDYRRGISGPYQTR